MPSCYYCGEHLGYFTFDYYCKFCSNLRRFLLLVGKYKVNQIINNKTNIDLSVNKEDEKEDENKNKSNNVFLNELKQKLELIKIE